LAAFLDFLPDRREFHADRSSPLALSLDQPTQGKRGPRSRRVREQLAQALFHDERVVMVAQQILEPPEL
jgi:hypothetical protein